MSRDTVPLTKTVYFISDPIPKYIFRKFIPTTRDFSIRHEWQQNLLWRGNLEAFFVEFSTKMLRDGEH